MGCIRHVPKRTRILQFFRNYVQHVSDWPRWSVGFKRNLALILATGDILGGWKMMEILDPILRRKHVGWNLDTIGRYNSHMRFSMDVYWSWMIISFNFKPGNQKNQEFTLRSSLNLFGTAWINSSFHVSFQIGFCGSVLALQKGTEMGRDPSPRGMYKAFWLVG